MKPARTQTDMFRTTQVGHLRAATEADGRDRFGHQYAGDTPRQRHSETSVAAGDAARGSAESIRRIMWEWIRDQGEHGATTEEVQLALGLRQSSASARRVELTHAGALRDTGRRRMTTGEREAAVYVAVGVGE